VLSDGGDPKHGTQAVRAVQAAIYRPRLEKGVPVETPGVMLEQPFYVLVETETDEPADAAPEPPPANPGG